MEVTGTVSGAKENVLISKGECSVTLLPQYGGKISSIRVKGHELLQAPLAPVLPRTQYMGFDEGDASGWDECLPSVAACTVETAAGPARIPDHGDLWQVAWSRVAASADSATLVGECFSLPLRLERTISLAQSAAGWRLQVDYKLTNTGQHPAPWSWSVHPLFTAEAGDEIQLPGSITKLRLEGSGGGRLGSNGDTVAWPVASLAGGGETNLSLAQAPESGIGDKLFAGPLAATENWCALVRPKAGVRIRVSFDTATAPYLGLWICYGGWPDRPGPKQVCVALEPCTAPLDSLAQTGPWSRVLAAGESYLWSMSVDLESI